jgi:excisionase family DNA binding protein
MPPLTLAEAADLLEITSDTLRQAIGRGSLKAVKLGPIWTVSRAEVERYRQKHLGKRSGGRKN